MRATVGVLGCDGGYPGPGGAGSGYLLRVGQDTVALDMGPGTLGRLQQEVAIEDLDAVFISHEHPDHRSDLEGLAVGLKEIGAGRPLSVYATAGVKEAFFFPDWGVFEWHVVCDGDLAQVGGLSFRFGQTDHGPETLALRADWPGGSFAYSADTGPGWSVSALGEKIGLFLCEATWDEAHKGTGGHLSGAEAGAMAKAAGVERLVITHIRPRLHQGAVVAEAAASFGAPVSRATPGAVYHL